MDEGHSPQEAPMGEKRHGEQSPVPPENDKAEGDMESSEFKVFVGGISRTTDENELFSIFRQYSPKEVMIMREVMTQRPRGFGFISFATQKDMEWAISDMHNTRIDGRVVTVSKARPFERPRGERSPRRPDSPERRPYQRRDVDWSRDFPRRYYNNEQPYEGGQRPYYDSRHRGYDAPGPNRRYQREEPHGPNQMYHHPPNHYDNRNDRGDHGGGYDNRRGGYRSGGPRDDYYKGECPRQGGQYMDYDRRQQMRDREEGGYRRWNPVEREEGGYRRWNPADRDRRHYNNNNYGGGGGGGGGRDMHPRWRSPEGEDRRREGPPRGDSRDDGGQYGPIRRRSEVRRVEPYRHRSRSPPPPDRRGR